MKSKLVRIPLYFHSFRIVLVDSLSNPDYAALTVWEKNKLVLYIKPDATAEIVAHEAVHLCNITFREVGIKLDVDNDEPQAYLIGWIVTQITNFIKQH